MPSSEYLRKNPNYQKEWREENELKVKAYQQIHYRKHSLQLKEYNKNWKKKNREKDNASKRKWNHENKKKRNFALKEYYQKIRYQIFILLGNKCANCGFADWRALQIDHVNGSGNKERKRFKGQYAYYRFILEKIREGSNDYQLLCANCNWIKKYELNENRHLKISEP